MIERLALELLLLFVIGLCTGIIGYSMGRMDEWTKQMIERRKA